MTASAVSSLNQFLNTTSGAIDPATGKPYTYTFLTTYSGNPNIRIAFNFLNFFAQDEIRFSQNFSLNVGARYEAILFPTFDAQAPYPLSRSIPNDYTDIAPRIGMTWSPFGNGKTVVHAAYGMYYDVPGLGTFYNAAQVNGHRLLYLSGGWRNGWSSGLSQYSRPEWLRLSGKAEHYRLRSQLSQCISASG